jgi:hypothetical protein
MTYPRRLTFHRAEVLQAMRSDAIGEAYCILTANHCLSVARCQGVESEEERR